ncbi:hypothetical protein Tco_0712523 [Tanacetum coccineum]
MATYGKMEYCEDKDDCFANFESEFPAIVLDDTLTSREVLSWKPTDLAETMIWYILKKTCVKLIRAF